MNVRLKKTFRWSSGLIYKDSFSINHYGVELCLLTVGKDIDEHNTAYERLKVWFDEILEGAIFIDRSSSLLEKYAETGARIIAFPGEPVDQNIGIMLYLKCNSIMENRLVATDVELWSRQGDSMSYLHSAGENVGPGFDTEDWWVDNRPNWYAIKHKTSDDNIVSLEQTPEWKQWDLSWGSDTKDSSSIITVNFGKNEDE